MNEQDASLQAITTVQQLGDEKALPRQGFSCSNGAACSSRAGGGLRRSRAVPLRPGDEDCSDDGQGSPRRKSSVCRIDAPARRARIRRRSRSDGSDALKSLKTFARLIAQEEGISRSR
jgi:hypothetical protein